MRSTTKISLFASALLLLSPGFALAAGLGKLSVLSGLGQPLKAEIEIVALQANEADSLSARIASPDAFRQAGVDYSGVMTQVRANVVKRGDRYVVSLATPQPVEEPYLDVLLELNSASGRLVRQYTFLLDPVGYQAPQPSVTPPVAVTPKEPAKPEPKPIVEAKPLPAPEPAPAAKAEPPAKPAPEAKAEAKPAPAPKAEKKTAAKPAPGAPAPADAKAEAKPAETTASGAKSYEVKQGDTLGEIAAANKTADVSLEQMLVAIQRANEDAFINKNINLVRTGRILRIPDAAEAAKLSQDEAVKVVNTQSKEFSDYRTKLAQQVAAAPAPAAEKTGQKAAGRITTKPEEKLPAEAPKDQVRLSRAEESKPGAGAKGLSADDLAAREKALRDAQQRVTELERNVKDLQTVVELKNQQLAELQKQAAASAAAAAAAKKAEASKATEPLKAPEPPKAAEPAKPVEPAKVEPPKPEAPIAATPDPVSPTPATPEVTPPVTTTETPSAPVVEPPAPVTPPEAKPVTPPASTPVAAAEEPTVFDMLMENPLIPAAIIAAVLALVGLAIWRRKQSAGLNNSLIGATTTDSSSVFGTTGGRSVDTGSHSMQTDFSQSALGSIDTDEVDPIAEADVYMAYGRDAQAEEILKEALQKDPSRQAVRVKLLEIYAGRKDLKAFEATAGEIYAATGGTGVEWTKAAEMGRGIDPDNPMYSHQGDPATAPGSGAAAMAMSAPMAAPVYDTTVEPAQYSAPEPVELSQPILDIDLGRGNASSAPDLALDDAQDDAGLDIDLNMGGDSKPEAETVDFSPSGTFIMDDATKKAVSDMTANAPRPATTEDLNIDFELPDSGDTPASANGSGMRPAAASSNVIDLDFKVDEAREVAAVDLSGLNLDLNEGDSDSHWQEVATKLDLAKAYEEMGDKDGARELLNEVLKEGDNAQQDQARTMLGAMR
ncbi:MAG TPA: FimV/HubP family polar landmark protein [Burkholderiales bacterium]|nr:FimV/HubP family polar landmark protein [Burkholderiales bacterium]